MRNSKCAAAVDLAYGPEPQDKCRRFQAQKRLDVDGVVGSIICRVAFEAQSLNQFGNPVSMVRLCLDNCRTGTLISDSRA